MVYPCVYRELLRGLNNEPRNLRFIPVYTGNSDDALPIASNFSVYPCVYRELTNLLCTLTAKIGLSLCIQGTLFALDILVIKIRFIPVYTGNSELRTSAAFRRAVYPCVYRELISPDNKIIYTLRFIPVYTGNSSNQIDSVIVLPVYPCVYRELVTPYGILVFLSRFIPVYTGNSLNVAICFI